MKKYIIKDSQGNKKTIYAENITHALSYVEDSKKVNDSKFYAEEDASEAKKRASKYGLQIKVGKKVSNGPNRGFDEIYYIGPRDKLTKMLKAEGFDDDEIIDMIEDNRVRDDENRPMTFKFFVNNKAVSEDEYINAFIKEATYAHQSKTAAKRVINEDKETAKSKGKSTFIFESGRKFSIICDSKVRDDTLEGKYHTEYGDKIIVSKIDASTYRYFDVDTKSAIRVSINALKEDIKAKRLLKDSIHDALDVEGYANYGLRIKEQLPYDLFYDGHRKGLDFNAVLKNYDSIAKQILAKIKEYLYDAKKTLISFNKY